MPYKDPEKKLKAMKRWRGEVMPRGYGKWLYARRKLRFDDAERFKDALLQIMEAPNVATARGIAFDAIEASRQAEEALGHWVADDQRG